MALVALTAGLAVGCGGGSDLPDDPVAAGDELYHGEATCAVCHGDDLRGTTMGPPFLHEVYVPSHHPDDAFRNAVRNGVQAHHWELGNMPALPHVDEQEVEAIIAYVRSEQQRAGLR